LAIAEKTLKMENPLHNFSEELRLFDFKRNLVANQQVK